MRLKDNPESCVNPDKRGNRTCVECYYAQVKDGQWCGTRRCWEAQCLVPDTREGK